MSSDHPSLENELRNLRAAEVDPDFIQRLARCAEGDWCRLSREEEHLELHLAGIRPAATHAALADRLEAIVACVSFPSANAPVPFPKPQRRYFRPAAAAAVALAGALAALMVPMREGSAPKVAAAPPAERQVPESPARSADLIPAGYSRGLSEASDQGVIWHDKTRPHRLVRLIYNDHYTLKDKDGRTYEIDRPRVEFVLVPARTD